MLDKITARCFHRWYSDKRSPLLNNSELMFRKGEKIDGGLGLALHQIHQEHWKSTEPSVSPREQLQLGRR